jgi:hypothetical protein
VGIRYGATALDVMYHGVPLGVAAVPGFEQPAHSTRLLQTRVVVDRFNVLQSDAQDLIRDASLNDRVELRITGDVAAKILLLGFSSPKVQVNSLTPFATRKPISARFPRKRSRADRNRLLNKHTRCRWIARSPSAPGGSP